MQYIDDINKLS